MFGTAKRTEMGAAAFAGGLRPLVRSTVRLFRAPARLRGRIHRRGTLSALDEHLLRDIGLTRSMTDAALTRRFWDR